MLSFPRLQKPGLKALQTPTYIRRHRPGRGRLRPFPRSTSGRSRRSKVSLQKCYAVHLPAGTDGHCRLCPIFKVSNVTGHNLPMLRTFLNVLPSSQSDDKYVVDAPFEFQISDVFSVPFVGTVVVSHLIHLGSPRCVLLIQSKSGVITSGVVHGKHTPSSHWKEPR